MNFAASPITLPGEHGHWPCWHSSKLIMPKGEMLKPVADMAPTENWVTEYDRAHMTVYLRLLDAADKGAPWSDVAPIVLGVDAIKEPARAKRAYDTHLLRARWIASHGYRDILRAPSRNED